MFSKFITLLVILIFLFSSASLEARTKKKKKRSSKHRVSRYFKHKKRSHKSAPRHSSLGPDLKDITVNSPYKEGPDNGVNSIEQKQ